MMKVADASDTTWKTATNQLTRRWIQGLRSEPARERVLQDYDLRDPTDNPMSWEDTHSSARALNSTQPLHRSRDSMSKGMEVRLELITRRCKADMKTSREKDQERIDTAYRNNEERERRAEKRRAIDRREQDGMKTAMAASMTQGALQSRETKELQDAIQASMGVLTGMQAAQMSINTYKPLIPPPFPPPTRPQGKQNRPHEPEPKDSQRAPKRDHDRSQKHRDQRPADDRSKRPQGHTNGGQHKQHNRDEKRYPHPDSADANYCYRCRREGHSSPDCKKPCESCKLTGSHSSQCKFREPNRANKRDQGKRSDAPGKGRTRR